MDEMDKHIVAIGGGGFGRSIGELKIEKYLLNLSSKDRPNVCFIPTATGDSDFYKLSFYRAFSRLNCNINHIDFFKRTIDLEEHITKQDIVYVGGGNTKSMLAVWKEWGLDLILKKAYDNGIILSGVSAGAICWFSKGITDSWENRLSILDCLSFTKGTCCPHYDEEEDRAPYVERSIKDGVIRNCVAIEGNCALHLKDGIPYKSINFGEQKSSYFISLEEGNLVKKTYDMITL
tara:strand:- start:2783 stop:3484 length:702 start_codon:yes stop_codon:yes gene_type:complete